MRGLLVDGDEHGTPSIQNGELQPVCFVVSVVRWLIFQNDVKLCMDSAYCQLGEYDVSIIFV